MRLLIIIPAMCAAFCALSGILYIAKRGRINEQRRLAMLTDGDMGRTRGRRIKSKDGVPLRRLERLADELYVAGIALRAEEFISIWVIVSALIPTLALFLGAPATFAVGMVALGAAAPIGIVKFKRNKMLSLFGKQLTDALTIICNALRAGLSFQTAMQTISTEMEEPISKEFGRVYRECQMGMPLETSLNRMVRRTGNQDLELVCSAVIIQRQIGGNLAQIIENISGTINQRIQLRGEIKAMTASGSMSGYIIGALPVLLLVALMLLNPGYVNVFFVTQAGRVMLVISVVLEVIGFTIVKKIINIKF
ncbi:MAG: type II secretion system F family protein [Clostridia bacterium]